MKFNGKELFLVCLCVTNLCATTHTVTSTADSGTGSFRETLDVVVPGDTISFNIPTGPFEIDLLTPLLIPVDCTIDSTNNGNGITFSTSTSAFMALGTNRECTITGTSGTMHLEIELLEEGGSASLVKTGDSTLSLTRGNNFTGGISIQSGAVSLGNSVALGPGTVVFTGNGTLSLDPGLNLLNEITLNESTRVVIDVPTGQSGILGSITGKDGSLLSKNGGGTLLLNGSSTFDFLGTESGSESEVGILAIPANGDVSISFLQPFGGTIQLEGDNKILHIDTLNMTGGILDLGTNTLSFGSNDNNNWTNIQNVTGSGGLKKVDSNRAYIYAPNSFTGGFILEGGTINLTGENCLGTGTVTFKSDTDIVINSGANLSNSIVLDGDQRTINMPPGTATLSGVISGSGSFIIVGSGRLVLTGENTYTKGLTLGEGLSGGTITIGHNTALGTAKLEIDTASNVMVADGINAANNIALPDSSSSTFEVSSGVGTLSGNITGDSTFIKEGAGTLILAGDNTFSGGTTINEGTLVVSGTLASEGDVTVNGEATFDASSAAQSQLFADSVVIGSLSTAEDTEVVFGTKVLTFGTSDNSQIDGEINGAGGALVKQGSGIATFSGNNVNVGEITVAEGTGVFNGVATSEVTGQSGSTIKGKGSIQGALSIESGGTLYPGNSIGTITVSSLDLNAGSTLSIEFDSPSNSSVEVNGAATLGGKLHLIQTKDDYMYQDSYTIISADSITGQFDSITGGIRSFNFSLAYENNDVILSYDFQGIDTIGLDGNRLKFANYLDAYSPVSYEFAMLAAQEGEALVNALNAASPARNAFGPFVTQQTVFSFSRMVNNYLDAKRFAKDHEVPQEVADLFSNYLSDADHKVHPEVDKNYHVWATGFIDFAHQIAIDQNPYFDFISEGVLIGFDAKTEVMNNVGFALGAAGSRITDGKKMGSAEIVYALAAIYADYYYQGFYAQAALWGAFHQIKNNRRIVYEGIDETAVGKINGGQIDPHVEFGYIYKNDVCELQPYVSLDWVVNWEGSYTETGAEDLNMHVRAQTASMSQFIAGMQLFQEIDKPYARFGFKEGASYINRAPFSTGTLTTSIFGVTNFVTLRSFTNVQNLGAVEFTFFVEPGRRRDSRLSIGYEGQFGSEYIFNELMVRFSKSF